MWEGWRIFCFLFLRKSEEEQRRGVLCCWSKQKQVWEVEKSGGDEGGNGFL